MKSKPSRKPSPRAVAPKRPSQRSAVLQSLIVAPRGGVHAHRHGQGLRG
jgi:hypothetical protein